MKDEVLTVSDLAQRWKCENQTIYKMREQGRIKSNPNLPGVKFTLEYIKGIETYGTDPLSPFERRKFEEKIKGLEEEVENFKKIFRQIGELARVTQ